MFEKYFHKRSLLGLLKYLKTSKNVVYGSSKQLLVETNLEDLKYDIKNMSDDEVWDKKLDLLVGLVQKILNATKEVNEMPSTDQQHGQGLKILAPKQLLTRLLNYTLLDYLLAQIKAGNNSEKLKNEIRQVVYSLLKSKNICTE